MSKTTRVIHSLYLNRDTARAFHAPRHRVRRLILADLACTRNVFGMLSRSVNDVERDVEIAA